MTNYDYKCTECNLITEIDHKMSEDPEIFCPECNSACKRQIGIGGGYILKGHGFYATDYRRMEETSKESATPRKEKNCPELDKEMDKRIKTGKRGIIGED